MSNNLNSCIFANLLTSYIAQPPLSLQSKIIFFYKPYQDPFSPGVPLLTKLPQAFWRAPPKGSAEEERLCRMEAGQRWRKVYERILKSKDEQFRNLLRDVSVSVETYTPFRLMIFSWLLCSGYLFLILKVNILLYLM
jgi:hypothetical protein